MKRLALLVAVAALVLLVAPPPSPVHLSYVTSDSMAPALEAGDAYVVVDAGEPTTGDVIVFDAEGRDGYTTHRVVDVTPEGYLTQGDANPTIDQAAGEPPVTEDRILGTVLSVGDQPVAVPFVGSLATMLSGPEPLLVAAGLLVIGGLSGRRGVPNRSAVRVRSVFVPLAMLFVLVAALSLAMAPTTHSVTYTVTDGDASAPNAIPVGEASTTELSVAVRGLPLTHTVFEAESGTVTAVEKSEDGTILTLELPAQEETGSVDVAVTAVPYPVTLPVPMIETLHAVHPIVAGLGTIGAAVLPLGLLYGLFLDGRALLRLPRTRRLLSRGERP